MSTTTELLATFRAEVQDLVAPYLWSDALVYTYIDDAQKQFCRETYGIDDARSFKLTITPGNEWYALDPQILRVLDAYDASTGDPVSVQTFDQTISKTIRFNGKTGALETLLTGLQKGYLRAYPVPAVAKTVNLNTLRLPSDVAAGDDFEIDAQHHLNLLDWVKYRAYSWQDAETNNDVKAEKHKATFKAYCVESKREQGRIRRRVAVVSYGGIR